MSYEDQWQGPLRPGEKPTEEKIEEEIKTPEKQEDVENVEQEKDRIGKNIVSRIKTKVGVLFDSYETGQERINDLKEQIDNLDFLENKEIMKMELEKCVAIKTKKEFVERVMIIIKPFIDLRTERPELFVREAGNDREFININDLLSYEISGNLIHIHVVPEEKVDRGLHKFRECLQNLAKIVNENKDIEIIEATSWIVAKHPKLLEKFGFSVDGEVSEKFRRTYFPGDKSKIFRAHMSRNDFLEKYLAK